MVSKDYYYKLSSEVETDRISAAVKLIEELQSENTAKEWDYAVSRLIKGLASSRAAARIGFSMALSEICNILYQRSKISISQFLELLNEHLSAAKASNKAKDERAYLFGWLFGLKALANSLMFKDVDSESFDEDFRLFVEKIVDLSLLKSWIREPCFHTLYEGLVKLGSSLSNSQLIYVLDTIHAKNLTISTEGLSIYLHVYLHRKAVLSQLTISNGWKQNNPVLKSNLATVARTLKDVQVGDGSGEENPATQKGSWSAQLHFVWHLVVDVVLFNETQSLDEDQEPHDKKRRKLDSSSKSKKKSKSDDLEVFGLKDFWKIAVDESLFSLKSSPERKYWGFEVFKLFLQKFAEFSKSLPSSSRSKFLENLDCLFTANFMRTMINQSANSKRLLNNLVKNTVLNGMVAALASQSDTVNISMVLFKNLAFSKHSNFNFDSITGTKTIDNLLNNIASHGSFADLSQTSSQILSVLNEQSDFVTEHGAKIQKWAVNEVCILLKHYKSRYNSTTDKSTLPANEWMDPIINDLVTYGYFKSKSKPEMEVSEYIVSKLGNLLIDILPLQRADHCSWVYTALKHAFSVENDKKGQWTPRLALDAELSKIKNRNFKVVNRIFAKKNHFIESEGLKSSKVKKLESFELIYSIVLLQFFGSVDAIESSISILEEIGAAYKKVEESLEESSENGDDTDSDAESVSASVVGGTEHDSVDILLDIILGFVHEKNAFSKKLSFIVWDFLAEEMKKKNFEAIFDILRAKENVEGERTIFDGSGDDPEEENEGEDDDEEEDEDEDEDEEDVEQGNFLDILDKKTVTDLAKALKIPEDGVTQAKSGDDNHEIEEKSGNGTEENKKKDDDDDSSDESDDSDDSDESDEDDSSVEGGNASDLGSSDSESSMDDEQMMAIDTQLSQIFKQRKDAMESSKTGMKRHELKVEAQENMVFFKSRILDLIDVYIAKLSKKDTHTGSLNDEKYTCLSMIEPLIDLAGLTENSNIREKCLKLIKKSVKIKIVIEKKDQEQIEQLLKKLHSKAMSSSTQAVSSACNLYCLQIAKALISGGESADKVIDIYCESMKKWANNKSKINHSTLFFDFVNYIQSKK